MFEQLPETVQCRESIKFAQAAVETSLLFFDFQLMKDFFMCKHKLAALTLSRSDTQSLWHSVALTLSRSDTQSCLLYTSDAADES